MTRGDPDKAEQQVPISPLRQLAQKQKIEKAIVQPKEGVTPAAESLYQNDWTLGYLTSTNGEYRDILNRLAPDDAGLSYDRENFLRLLSQSLSLSFEEKTRVLNELSNGLHQNQVDALVETLEDERRDFESARQKESEETLVLYLRAHQAWAQILLGATHGRAMVNFVEATLSEDGDRLPKIFARNYRFWLILADHTITWGLDIRVIQKMINKGVEAHQKEGGETPFELALMDCIYRTNHESLEHPRVYLETRLRVVKDCLIEPLTKKTTKIIACRAWLLGIGRDCLRLGQKEQAIEAIEKARAILDTVSPNLEGDARKDTDALYLIEKLRLTAYEKPPNSSGILEAMRKIFACSESAIKSEAVVASLLLSKQLTLCTEILVANLSDLLNKEETDPFAIVGAATDLLVVGVITQNEEANQVALTTLNEHLLECLVAGTENIEEIEVGLLATLYVNLMIYLRLAGDKADEYEADFRVLWDSTCAVLSGDLHQKLDKKPRGQKWSKTIYLTIRMVERDGQGKENAFLSTFKSYLEVYEALMVLYSLSANPEIRGRCKEVARMLMTLANKRLLGLPQTTQFSYFDSFVNGTSFAGSQASQVQRWRGDLSWGELVEPPPQTPSANPQQKNSEEVRLSQTAEEFKSATHSRVKT